MWTLSKKESCLLWWEKRPERRNRVMPGQDTAKLTLGCKEKNEDRPPLPLYLSIAWSLMPYKCSVIMHLSIKIIHPVQKQLPERIFPAHPCLSSHWGWRWPSARFPNSSIPCQPGVPALGQVLRTLCCGWGPPGPQWKRVPGTSFSWLCVEESRWMWMSENRHAANTRQKQTNGEQIQSKEREMEEEEVYGRTVLVKRKNEVKKWTDSVIPETGQGYLHKLLTLKSW